VRFVAPNPIAQFTICDLLAAGVFSAPEFLRSPLGAVKKRPIEDIDGLIAFWYRFGETVTPNAV
jgi:hypothetical protein